MTAIIKDSSGRGHIRHIKHVIGDYWVTDIDKQTYVFKIEDSRIITYKETAAKSCRILFYSTKHYLPISPEDNRNLQETLRLNQLPRMNTMMFGAFKILSQREKKNHGKEFEPHNLSEVIETVTSKNQQFQVQAQNLKQYFDNMATYKIVTPVREVTEFIEDDLVATDPKFLGDIYNALQRTDFEHKKVANSAITAKKNYLLLIGIIAIVGALGFAGYYLISNGSFGNILPSFGPSATGPNAQSNGKMTDAEVFAKYPTPEALNGAIAKGDLQLSQLSPNMQKLVKNYKPTPTPAAATP